MLAHTETETHRPSPPPLPSCSSTLLRRISRNSSFSGDRPKPRDLPCPRFYHGTRHAIRAFNSSCLTPSQWRPSQCRRPTRGHGSSQSSFPLPLPLPLSLRLTKYSHIICPHIILIPGFSSLSAPRLAPSPRAPISARAHTRHITDLQTSDLKPQTSALPAHSPPHSRTHTRSAPPGPDA